VPKETTLEPNQLLEKAIMAANSENWLLVNQQLQLLPIGRKRHELGLLSELELEKAIYLAKQVLLSGDFQQKWQVASILPKLIRVSSDSQQAIAALISILQDEQANPELHWFVVRILGEFDEPQAILALVQLLQETEDRELATLASEALAQIGTSAIESLSKLLADENTRLMATGSLAAIRKSETIELLLQVVDDSDREVRLSAIEALASFHDPRIDRILVQALTDTAATVRKEAVIALGMRAELNEQLNLVEKIKPLLYDLNPEVCRQAALSLGRIGSEAVEILFSVLESKLTPVWLQIELVRALSWSKSDRALDYLQQALAWTDEVVSQEIVSLLGREGLPNLKSKATQILVDYLHSGQAIATNLEIKKAIAMSIGELGGTAGITLLNQLAEDTEATVRLHAIAALKKLERNT
jgi:HEAT repeat protein